MLADQLLRRLEALHAHNYLHRDIKPENFLLGIGRQGNVVYMTDLGLAVHRRHDRWDASSIDGRDDIPARPPELLGTCRYASINGYLDVGK
jgi:serine/threonine protein kinase